jgi:hypothetical protein
VIPENITPSILRAEQVLWLTLVEMMGGGSVGSLTNSIHLITGMSDSSKKLEFESSASLAMTSSFGSVDPVIANLIMKFSFLGEKEVPLEVWHWKSPWMKVHIY